MSHIIVRHFESITSAETRIHWLKSCRFHIDCYRLGIHSPYRVYAQIAWGF